MEKTEKYPIDIKPKKRGLLKKVICSPLSFLSYCWELVYRARRFFYTYGIYHQNQFQVPIISIGNLTFGGTGKTPLTLWIADRLESKGKKVMILTRGYKGELESSSGVLESSRRLGFNPIRYGDEAVLLARKLSSTVIIVGKDRSQNLEFYFEKYRPDIVLLDDGHQHLKLARELNIVLFDGMMPLDKYQTPPLGYMREGFSGLRDTNIVIIGKADKVGVEKVGQIKNQLRPYLPTNTVFGEVSYRPRGFYNSEFQKVLNLHEIEGKKVISLAAIGSPDLFFSMVRSYGVDVLDEVSFADHHVFKTDEITPIVEKALKEDAYILTTEKDIVKLRRVVDSDRLLYLDIELEFLSGEREVCEIISQVCHFSI